jgi:bifunctional UDP-N-acetylglucosamine pyrophosphorylase/glucosamine-1-phosphate N-acetyltransferase
LNIHTIILAAGKGTRMNTNLPKVMQPLGGQTLISHVIKTAKINCKDITVIVGHQKDLLKEHIASIDSSIQTAEQNEQLGTAHAVKTAAHLIKDNEKVMVLYGDVPLISNETIEALINSGQECTLLSMKLNDPTGYGRIVTNEENSSP